MLRKGFGQFARGLLHLPLFRLPAPLFPAALATVGLSLTQCRMRPQERAPAAPRGGQSCGLVLFIAVLVAAPCVGSMSSVREDQDYLWAFEQVGGGGWGTGRCGGLRQHGH